MRDNYGKHSLVSSAFQRLSEGALIVPYLPFALVLGCAATGYATHHYMFRLWLRTPNTSVQERSLYRGLRGFYFVSIVTIFAYIGTLIEGDSDLLIRWFPAIYFVGCALTAFLFTLIANQETTYPERK